jgi:hypothetical protein
MIQGADTENAVGVDGGDLLGDPASRLLAGLGPDVRRAVQSIHLRAPLISTEELRQELLANLLQAAARGRGHAAPVLLKEARSRLSAWARSECRFRALPRCIDAGQPAPSAEDAWLASPAGHI